ncbi:site-specific DNA-methyltransferase [Helicobacter fennelliae]|uniref:site-specific DNA-methyltransferase (adenine-specific) n=3 Tax=Helicobacter fennelliae TaxID=215 RepID=T1DVF7_9HELI|nr:site-specific DNA-methyltransferase [Helicobacter fennelliae]GAD18502.1 type III restriction-modification system methylation subunit [Helicobacter fennelliae MRY12-0050]STP08135.1 type III restriction-modification system modification subunit [Helicobacter fennelliae]
MLDRFHKLKEYFPQCFDKNGDLMPHKLQKAILDLAQEINAQANTATQDLENEAAFSLSKESYSLNWLGKSYAKLLRHLPTHTLIAQDSAHNAQPQNANSKNVLIKGDNLEVLKHLKNAYYRKVKMIYIDPPYNTGNGDFIYNDERSFTPQSLAQMANIELEEASSILNLTLKNSSTHSAWLSFMYPRLYIARQLLRDDGVIFISIDDNEQANLKLLCDEIFGEDNFVVSIPRLTSAQRPAQEKYIGVNHDYILCYSKNKSYNFHSVINRDFSKEVFCDNIGKFFKNDTSPILASATQGYSNGGDYDIEFNGKIFSPIDSSGNRRRWLWTKERMQKAIELGIIVETKNSLRVRNYINKEFQVGTNKMVDKDEKLSITTFDLMKADFVNDKGTDEIKELSIPFSFPKPTNLIKTLLQLSTTPNSNDIILDFFAGSGTTAQAVMELNAQDKGNREFLLVQLDEVIDKSKSKTAYEFCKNELGSENPTIFDITKERINAQAQKSRKIQIWI